MVKKDIVVELPREVLVIDTETTGLGRNARLVEVALVRWRDGVVCDAWSTLINPRAYIPSFVTAIHGITNRHVASAPETEEALWMLAERLDGTTVVAHNASFDVRMIAQDAARVGRESPLAAAMCTVRLAKRAFPSVGGYSLSHLTRALGLRETPTHRAEADARTTAELYGAIERELAREAK